MIRVALCDDHDLVRRGLALLLGGGFALVPFALVFAASQR